MDTNDSNDESNLERDGATCEDVLQPDPNSTEPSQAHQTAGTSLADAAENPVTEKIRG